MAAVPKQLCSPFSPSAGALLQPHSALHGGAAQLIALILPSAMAVTAGERHVALMLDTEDPAEQNL